MAGVSPCAEREQRSRRTGSRVKDVVKLELKELGRLLHRAEYNLVGLGVEVLGDERGEQVGRGGGLLSGL